MDFIKAIENAIGKKIKKNFMPLQAGDVPATYDNVDSLIKDFVYKSNTTIHTRPIKLLIQVGFLYFYPVYRNIFA